MDFLNISSYLYTMRNLMEIKRYQNKISLVPRTIAEHKFGYSKMAYMLSYWENRLGGNVNLSEVLKRCVLSGTIKAMTGDIQNNTISATPGMRPTLLKTYDLFYDSSYRVLLPNSISDEIRNSVLYSKDSSAEGKIIRVASLLNRFLECFDEVSLGNGFKFKDIMEDTVKELLSVDLISAKLLLSEMPKGISIHLDRFKEEIKDTKQYVYMSVDSKDIFEFDLTFYKYATEVRGLMGVARYQNIFKHRTRSVAEHQWFVSLVALFIYYKHPNRKSIDIDDVLTRTFFHDDIELYTGDIITGTKNANKDTKSEVEKVEAKYYDSIYSKFIPHDIDSHIRQKVLHPKDASLEGQIMAVSDIIDTIYESHEEIALGNLEQFARISTVGFEKLNTFIGEFNFLSELLPTNHART